MNRIIGCNNYYLVILLCFILQGCMMTGINQAGETLLGGTVLVVTGILLMYLGYIVATKTTLEKWSMKLLCSGLLIFLMG